MNPQDIPRPCYSGFLLLCTSMQRQPANSAASRTSIHLLSVRMLTPCSLRYLYGNTCTEQDPIS